MNLQMNFRKVIIVLFLLGLPLLSINMQRNPGDSPWFLKPFTWSFSLMHTSYTSFSTAVRNSTDLYINLWDIKAQNRDLKKENSRLKAELLVFRGLEKENHRLHDLLEFQQRMPLKLNSAQVIGHDIVGERDSIIINRGSKHRVTAGQAVVSNEGVVGYVLVPSLVTSQVLLATDRYAVIDAMVQRSRARGIIEGTNKGFTQLKHLERADDVRIGDLVVTSGLGKMFPKDFPIGTVTQVEKNQYGVSQEVDVRPIVSARQLEEVFVIERLSNNVADSAAKKDSTDSEGSKTSK